jgi:hypothetical protein
MFDGSPLSVNHDHSRPDQSGMPTTNGLPLSEDAAIVLGLAGTALPFAGTHAAEAERWLRALRLYGHVGAALQGLGVGEAPLETTSDPAEDVGEMRRNGADHVALVNAEAQDFATRRGGDRVCTIDVLFAVLAVYDKAFDRALYVRGTTRRELLERLDVSVPAL